MSCPVLLLIEKSCEKSSGGSGFPLYLSDPLRICPMPYNHKCNVLSTLLNKKNSSFLKKYHIRL